jgi:hypothetical protein
MADFRCVPIPTETAERFRRSGIDDNGNVLRRMVSDGAAPCRHCLREARMGEPVLLGSYNLAGPLGIYWTPSPIFVHAEPCERFETANEVPEIVRGRLVSVRSYDQDEQCIYDLGEAVEGEAIDRPLARAIADPRTKFVNIHTAKPGCLLVRVEHL